MITLPDYFAAHDDEGGDLRQRYALELTPDVERNALRTIALANAVLGQFGEWRRVNSGWRPPTYNAKVPGAARRSLHMSGKAIDLADPDGTLDDWLMSPIGRAAIVKLGLWMEHPSCTRTPTSEGWTHLQTEPPPSGNRAFYK